MAAAPKTLSAEVAALTLAAQGERGKLRRQLRGIFGKRRAYRKLFFNPDGTLKPEGREVLLDLVETAGIGMAVPDLSHEGQTLFEGQRRLVLHVFGRFNLPEGRVDQLERDLTNLEDDEA